MNKHDDIHDDTNDSNHDSNSMFHDDNNLFMPFARLLLPTALGLGRKPLCCALRLEFGRDVHLDQGIAPQQHAELNIYK